MTAFVLSTSVSGAAVIFSSVATNDSVTLLPGLHFINTTTNALNILHNNNTVLNMGTLLSGGSYGLVVNGFNDCNITNTATGTIGTLAGTAGYNGVYIGGDRNQLSNMGHIFSSNGTGVYFTGDDNILSNGGLIQGTDVGLVATGLDYTIHNSGTIEAGTNAASVAIYLAGTGFNKTLVNTGLIQALTTDSGIGIQLQTHNLTTIINSGTIQSLSGVAIEASVATGGVHLTNTGAIISSTAFTSSVVGTALVDTIINSGSINRSVALGDGADLFDGIGGTVGGTVIGGDGDDVFRISDANILLFEDDAQGTDRVESTVNFELGDNFENLRLLGDAVEGAGNELANTITGNAKANVLHGQEGADTLLGGSGADKLYGGTEADRLNGGKGNDTLDGDAGADIFMFNTTLSASTNVDKIAGLSSIDQIELDNDIFTALGAGFTVDEFRNIATGTSFVDVDASDNIIYLKSTGDLYYDRDGSGTTYAAIKFADLAANTTVNFSHFLLVE